MSFNNEDEHASPLEDARSRLYDPDTEVRGIRSRLSRPRPHLFSHAWGEESPMTPPTKKRHIRVASIFFIASFLFFFIAASIAGYLLYFGGNAVSVKKIEIDIQGPTAIAGGDTVPILFTITNKNTIAISNATLEIDFPDGTRSASNVLQTYPRYVEDLGTIESGATVARPVKVILFGGAGQVLTLPVSFSYSTSGSNSVFVKKTSYTVTISSTPLSISVDTPVQIIAGEPFSIALTARSNAPIAVGNVVIESVFPFGFSVASSSVPLVDNSSFLLGTLEPGASKTITLTGVFPGQNSEQGTFHFTIGTAASAKDSAVAIRYMTQEATIATAAPFITTKLSVNGNTSDTLTLLPGKSQNVTVSYVNTLPESVRNITVSVVLSGSAIDYNSIRTTSGFYQSSNHTVIFSKDTDPSLATLSPGASGLGTFAFSTLAPGAVSSPTITFTTSVSGMRAGETSVTESLNTSATKVAKVMTAVALSSPVYHSAGPLPGTNSGPIPPQANKTTTYTIVWNVQDMGSALAGSTVTTTLPTYVTYTGVTNGNFSYDSGTRTVTWNIGDIPQGSSAQGAFQVSLLPSTSQRGAAPMLTGNISFLGYDRFAGVQISASVDPATTATPSDPGYVNANAVVQ